MIAEHDGTRKPDGIAPNMSTNGPWMRPMPASCLERQHQPSHIQTVSYSPQFTPNEPELGIVPTLRKRAKNIQPNFGGTQPVLPSVSPAEAPLPSRRSRVIEHTYAPLKGNDSSAVETVDQQLPAGLHAKISERQAAPYDNTPAQMPLVSHPQGQALFAAHYRAAPQAPIQPQFTPQVSTSEPTHPITRFPSTQHRPAQGFAPMQASAYPTPASPNLPASLKPVASISPKAKYATPACGLQRVPDEEDLEDEQEDAMPTASMATPTAVLCSSFTMPIQSKRKGLLIGISLAIVLIGTVALLWATGVLGRLLPSATAPTNDRIPAVFMPNPANSQDNNQPTELVPALSASAPVIDTFTVEPASAIAPSTLTFTLRTVGDTTSIRLLNAQGMILAAKITSRLEGDVTLWSFEVPFDAAYTGAIHAYLRNQDGSWVHSEITCQISVE